MRDPLEATLGKAFQDAALPGTFPWSHYFVLCGIYRTEVVL